MKHLSVTASNTIAENAISMGYYTQNAPLGRYVSIGAHLGQIADVKKGVQPWIVETAEAVEVAIKEHYGDLLFNGTLYCSGSDKGTSFTKFHTLGTLAQNGKRIGNVSIGAIGFNYDGKNFLSSKVQLPYDDDFEDRTKGFITAFWPNITEFPICDFDAVDSGLGSDVDIAIGMQRSNGFEIAATGYKVISQGLGLDLPVKNNCYQP